MDTAPRILQTEHSALGVGCRDWDARSERVALSAKAGVAYAVTVLAIGFQLGTASVLLLAPRVGSTIVVSVESPIIVTASWYVSSIWIVVRRRFDLSGHTTTLADRSRKNGTEVTGVRGMHQASPLGRTRASILRRLRWDPPARRSVI